MSKPKQSKKGKRLPLYEENGIFLERDIPGLIALAEAEHRDAALTLIQLFVRYERNKMPGEPDPRLKEYVLGCLETIVQGIEPSAAFRLKRSPGRPLKDSYHEAFTGRAMWRLIVEKGLSIEKAAFEVSENHNISESAAKTAYREFKSQVK